MMTIINSVLLYNTGEFYTFKVMHKCPFLSLHTGLGNSYSVGNSNITNYILQVAHVLQVHFIQLARNDF